MDFEETLKDSPLFRSHLELAEADTDVLETRLNKVATLCSSMIQAGKLFSSANRCFIGSIGELDRHFKEDAFVSAVLSSFVANLTELQTFHNMLMEQAQRTVCKNLRNFIDKDIAEVNKTKKMFDKLSDDLDGAYSRSAMVAKSKQSECVEADLNLTAMRRCFNYTALDYVFQINLLHSNRRFEILDTMMSFMRASSTYFHQGFDMFEDVDLQLRQLSSTLEELRSKAKVERKEMEERHTLVAKRENSLNGKVAKTETQSGPIRMEGYLFKRTSNAFRSWVRRWFVIQNNQLVYRKRSKDELTVMEDDLRLCTVRIVTDLDRRFCFEVLSPTKQHLLQADTESHCMQWIEAMHSGIATAYNDRSSVSDADESSSSVTDSSAMAEGTARIQDGDVKSTDVANLKLSKSSICEQILRIPGNEKCADCAKENPRWASINLGITLCIECSGIHRSLGVQRSKVRSMKLDAWEPELLKVMADLGNSVVNAIFEAEVSSCGSSKPAHDCSREVREAWIKAKYLQRRFVRQFPIASASEEKIEKNRKTVRKWSVRRLHRRRSRANSAQTSPTPADDTQSENNVALEGSRDHHQGNASDVQAGISSDSGLGESALELLVFGAGIPNVRLSYMEVDSSDESLSDAESNQTCDTVESEDLSKLNPNLLFYKAALARNLPVMLEALAHGATPNWTNEEDRGRCSLHQAVISGSMSTLEFILLNSGKVNSKDALGQMPLHIAAALQHTGQVLLLLKRGPSLSAQDNSGNDALAIALNTTNADIVTLLRLSKLDLEMKQSEYGNPGDETFGEVFKDFSQLAANDPDKLKRANSKD